MGDPSDDNPYRPPRTRIDRSDTSGRTIRRLAVAAIVLMPVYGLIGAMGGLLLGSALPNALDRWSVQTRHSWELPAAAIGACIGEITAVAAAIHLSRRDRSKSSQ